ncbi:MAG: hypothetical protein BWY59_01840 [Verrucomicrobia bacterium ADurb.Bin345]|nr:MAG: hypothetical protein BWY59_01840 [Verrucomicrobia bacterium ADurb.Bin345]
MSKFSRHWKLFRPFFQTLENGLFVLLLSGSFIQSRASDDLLGTNEQHHLLQALSELEMTERDLSFEKDVGKPVLALERTRRLLAEPTQLPALGAQVLAAVSSMNTMPVWPLAADLLEVKLWDADSFGEPFSHLGPWHESLPALAPLLDRFLADASRASARLAVAYEALSAEEMQRLAADFLAGLYNAEDRPEVRDVLSVGGVGIEYVDRAVRESLMMDPEPPARVFIETLRKVDLGALLDAGKMFQRAVARLAEEAGAIAEWPDSGARFETPLGVIVIGTKGADTHETAALLILDPGGNDTYRGEPGAANGLLDRRLSAIVELEGSDRYIARGVLGAGSALFGVALVLDVEGDDCHVAKHMGQGAGLFGVGWLEDRAGDDVYRAGAFAQGAGYGGFGYLLDYGGNDFFDVGQCGQGYAGVLGVGILVNREGNDRYYAGGREPDHERNPDRYLSLAQGFAIGMRPFAGGGVGALVDLAGNDTYAADVYGQGVSYWYSIGMLLDAAGQDTYTLHQYGQGAGIHLSVGLLADGGGDDTYTGGILVQGAAHDYAVGMLLDKSGNDTYTADQHGQGRAINNALGMLVDSGGDDAYFARQPDQCQGIGNDGDKREYGSLALLLDLGGRDQYATPTEDGEKKPRPDFGIIYDLEGRE